MSNYPYGQHDNQQNPFTQGRYQQQNPYMQNDDHGQSNPYGQPSQPHQNPFLGNQIQPYRPSGTPPELRRFEQINMINHVGSALFPVLGVVMFFVEQGKNPVYDKHLRETMNMALTRIGIGAAAAFASGWLAALLGLLSAAYFFLAIFGAMEGVKAFKEGRGIEYKGAIPFTRPDE